MKAWWMRLPLREKYIVSVGTICFAALIFYGCIWWPLTSKVNSLRAAVKRDQVLLTWMRAADQQLQMELKSSQKKMIPSSASLLGFIQNHLHQQKIFTDVLQIRQAENNAVQINFQKINFDKLMAWLIQIGKQYGIMVSQMTITPKEAPGMVEAQMVLAV